MKIELQTDSAMGATVTGFQLAGAAGADMAELREAIYQNRILVIKDQHLEPAELVALGKALGTIEVYYEPMYHHPQFPEIFVSGMNPAGSPEGVPQTGKFWHADYSFMPNPFSITVTYPQIVPKNNRGTYFIDMAKAFAALPSGLQDRLRGAKAEHSPRRYFKIRPSDVYRPIHEVQADIEQVTPAVFPPAVFRHPVTGEEILYVSEAATFGFVDADGHRLPPEILQQVLELSGQLDQSFADPQIHLQAFVEGDLLAWDNRVLVHRALHGSRPEPSQSYRITVHDQYPFFGAAA